MTTPTPKRRGLGRGLDALLGGPLPEVAVADAADPPRDTLLEIDPSEVVPNPEQPRQVFEDEALQALAESIRQHGVLHPIVVERRSEGGFQLVAGERRLRASLKAGAARVPAIVRPAAESARHALELALTENLVRSDLNPLEEAAAYARLADTFGLTHDAIALRVGRSRPAISNTIRLLSLPATVQTAVAEGRLGAGHARALLAIPDPQRQEALAETISNRGMSVREVERLIATETGSRAAPKERGHATPPGRRGDEALARGLEAALGTPVTITRRGQGGQIAIEFFGDEDLGHLYDRLGGSPL